MCDAGTWARLIVQEAYLFSAALSELRTEVQVQARNDAISQQSANATLQREVDSLSQRMREDMQALKNEYVAVSTASLTAQHPARHQQPQRRDGGRSQSARAQDLRAVRQVHQLARRRADRGRRVRGRSAVRAEDCSVKLDTTRNFMLLIGMGVRRCSACSC